MAAYLFLDQQCFRKVFSVCGRYFVSLLLGVFLCIPAWAAQDRYHFETPVEEKRYQHLLLQLRCMVCENQSLAESHAPLAEDLRLEVYQQMVVGKTDPEIKAFLVERYGASVLYEPPVQNNTLILWLTPILLLLVGIFFWIYKVRGNKKI